MHCSCGDAHWNVHSEQSGVVRSYFLSAPSDLARLRYKDCILIIDPSDRINVLAGYCAVQVAYQPLNCAHPIPPSMHKRRASGAGGSRVTWKRLNERTPSNNTTSQLS